MDFAQTEHRAAAHVELTRPDVTDLKPIVSGPGLESQLPAREGKLTVGIVTHGHESASGAAAADSHLAKSALADVGDVIRGNQLTASNRDSAGGIDSVADGQRGGRVERPARDVQSAGRQEAGYHGNLGSQRGSAGDGQTAQPVVCPAEPHRLNAAAVHQATVQPASAIDDVKSGQGAAFAQQGVRQIQRSPVIQRHSDRNEGRVRQVQHSAAIHGERAGKLERQIGRQVHQRQRVR